MASGLSSIDWGVVIGTGTLFSILALTHVLLNYNAMVIPIRIIGQNRIAHWLYTLLVLPGIILHELSHAVTALILLVNVYDFHIGPEPIESGLRVGYIKHEKTDVFRTSIIGLAPLITGAGVIYVILNLVFDITYAYDTLASDGWFEAIQSLELNSFNGWMWLAIYLIFAVSASMFPSPSDRRSWLPVILFLLLIFVIGGVAGIVCTLMQWLAEPINAIFRWLMLIFGLALVIDLPILLLLAAGTRVVTKQPRSI